LTESSAFGAVDLGASSGRVFRGDLIGGRVHLEEVARFVNGPVSLPDGSHWNLAGLFEQVVRALAKAGPLHSIGVDSWGVDYSLLRRGRSDGLPFHYRDARTGTGVTRAFDAIDPTDLYAATGIQVMPINTVFQLLAEPEQSLAGSRLLLISDLVNYWLTGIAVNEVTQASTTGLLDPHGCAWSQAVIQRLGLPPELFGDLVEPGAALGRPRAGLGLSVETVTAAAGHDTASAFVAAPLRDANAAILSSGTWSLLGTELPAPILSEAARHANLSNERGVDGTTRLLRNVMGLWLEQECARAWNLEPPVLHQLAEVASPNVPVFDPDHASLLHAGADMPERIVAAWRAAGQQCPDPHPGVVIRSVHLSLACKYRFVLELLEEVTGRSFDRIHVIGGGARVAPLCRLTAQVTGREVVAGPVEASALGNVLIQARAAGAFDSLQEIRDTVSRSLPPKFYPPDDVDSGEEHYQRFLQLTGLRPPVQTST